MTMVFPTYEYVFILDMIGYDKIYGHDNKGIEQKYRDNCFSHL